MHRQAGVSKLMLPVFILLGIALLVMLQFGFIFLLLATLPSFVAYYIDADKGKPTFKIVAACNFAATLPSIMPMIRASLKMKHYDVSYVLQDPDVWLIVYGGAALGWGIVYSCRIMANAVISIIYDYNRESLEQFQGKLVREWGEDITK